MKSQERCLSIPKTRRVPFNLSTQEKREKRLEFTDLGRNRSFQHRSKRECDLLVVYDEKVIVYAYIIMK